MEFDPELWLRIKNKKITPHQIRILSELALTHSQTQAAANLSISVPVLHRHLRSLINKLGIELVVTTPNGTWLTKDGQLVLKIYNRYNEMLMHGEHITVYCTPITQELLTETITDFEIAGKKYHISVNDDGQNLKALYLGRADLVIFDDPNYAIEFEGFKEDKILAIDIFQDTLAHQKKGSNYIKYKFGAQRLGYRYLDANQIRYKILYEVSNLKHLLNSGKSFFINQSLLIRNGMSLNNDYDLKIFTHPIMAVSINPTDEVRHIALRIRDKAQSASLAPISE